VPPAVFSRRTGRYRARFPAFIQVGEVLQSAHQDLGRQISGNLVRTILGLKAILRMEAWSGHGVQCRGAAAEWLQDDRMLEGGGELDQWFRPPKVHFRRRR